MKVREYWIVEHKTGFSDDWFRNSSINHLDERSAKDAVKAIKDDTINAHHGKELRITHVVEIKCSTPV